MTSTAGGTSRCATAGLQLVLVSTGTYYGTEPVPHGNEAVWVQGPTGLVEAPEGDVVSRAAPRAASNAARSPRTPGTWFPHAFGLTMAHFRQALAAGKTPLCSVQDNLNVMAVLEATYRSGAEHRVVELAEIMGDRYACGLRHRLLARLRSGVSRRARWRDAGGGVGVTGPSWNEPADGAARPGPRRAAARRLLLGAARTTPTSTTSARWGHRGVLTNHAPMTTAGTTACGGRGVPRTASCSGRTTPTTAGNRAGLGRSRRARHGVTRRGAGSDHPGARLARRRHR